MSSPGLEAEPFPLVLGLDTFGDLTHDRQDRSDSHAHTIRIVVEQGVLADEAGVDFFGIGEHHTNDFPMPAGDMVLAAIAARTSRIHLGSAVTVLSSDDPRRPSRAPQARRSPVPGLAVVHQRRTAPILAAVADRLKR